MENDGNGKGLEWTRAMEWSSNVLATNSHSLDLTREIIKVPPLPLLLPLFLPLFLPFPLLILPLLLLLLQMTQQPRQLRFVVSHVSCSCGFTGRLSFNNHKTLLVKYRYCCFINNEETETQRSLVRKCHNLSVAEPGFRLRSV